MPKKPQPFIGVFTQSHFPFTFASNFTMFLFQKQTSQVYLKENIVHENAPLEDG
jgi:hypothetical protein